MFSLDSFFLSSVHTFFVNSILQCVLRVKVDYRRKATATAAKATKKPTNCVENQVYKYPSTHCRCRKTSFCAFITHVESNHHHWFSVPLQWHTFILATRFIFPPFNNHISLFYCSLSLSVYLFLQ